MNVSVRIHVHIYVQIHANMYWSGHILYCTYMYVLYVQDTYTIMHIVHICKYLYVNTYLICKSTYCLGLTSTYCTHFGQYFVHLCPKSYVCIFNTYLYVINTYWRYLYICCMHVRICTYYSVYLHISAYLCLHTQDCPLTPAYRAMVL